jgi:hypothetical protein
MTYVGKYKGVIVQDEGLIRKGRLLFCTHGVSRVPTRESHFGSAGVTGGTA